MAKKLVFQQPCTEFLEMTFILSHITGDVCISSDVSRRKRFFFLFMTACFVEYCNNNNNNHNNNKFLG